MSETMMYTQDQLDIALLKQETGTTSNTLSRIENELISIDKKIDSKIDALDKKLDYKIDTNFKWMLSFMLSGFIGVLGLMAHGFKWF